MKTIYLTVDTECHDIHNKNLYIDGFDGKEFWGIKKILELGKQANIPVNFFLDVGESKEYGDDFIKDIVTTIHSYGQPVFFHLHPDYISGDHSRSFLWQYSYEEKKAIFEDALSIYEKFCGKNERIIFRAGRYGVDTEFYEILQNENKEFLDLSYLSGSGKMCHVRKEEVGVENKPIEFCNVMILPNTCFVALDFFGVRKTIGLDSADATYNEFKRFLIHTKLKNIVWTMHSWNFIRKWFYAPGKFKGDEAMVRKFKKSINTAREFGYIFGNLADVELSDDKDEMVNLCKGTKGKFLSIVNNYLRFKKIGRLNKKYFFLYATFYAGLLILVSVIIKLLIS